MKPLNGLLRDPNGRIVIWQWPNLPLWLWIASAITGHFLHGGAKTNVSVIGSLALAIWAILEIGWGQSRLRRVAGAIVLLVILVDFGMRLRR